LERLLFRKKVSFGSHIRRSLKFQGLFVILWRLKIRNFRPKFGENQGHFGNVKAKFLLAVECQNKKPAELVFFLYNFAMET